MKKNRVWLKALLTLTSLAIAAMWVYAFVFAPRDGVNPVKDPAWTDGAEAICSATSQQLNALVFKVEITGDNKDTDLPKYVANLDKGYLLMTRMVDDLDALPRSSEKAQRIVPRWIADYRAFVEDLRLWIEELRAGRITKFAVGVTDTGVPVEERINTFAVENRIRICSTDYLTA
jgi:hypothetical protein